MHRMCDINTLWLWIVYSASKAIIRKQRVEEEGVCVGTEELPVECAINNNIESTMNGAGMSTHALALNWGT